MDYEGDAIRRFDKVKLVSIEKKTGETGNAPCSEYVVNYLVNGNLRFSHLRMYYVDAYTKPYEDRGEMHKRVLNPETDLSDEEKKDPEVAQQKHETTFAWNLIKEISDALTTDTPVNLVIEAVHKGAIVEFIRRVEFT